MRALVLGGHGAVGRVVVERLDALGHDVVPAGRGAGRPGVQVDVSAPAGLERLARLSADVDVVVNASGVEDPRLLTVTSGAALVEISATASYLETLAAAAPGSTAVVLGAGLVPGLSTSLVRSLDPRPGTQVDLLVMLGSGEEHGTAAVAWTAGLVGADLHAPPEGGRVLNLRSGRRARGPDGRRRRYLRADFPDHVLTGVDVRTYLTTSSAAATFALAAVARMPAARPLLRRAPHLGSDEWHLVAVDRDTGRSASASGRGQSRSTGLLVAAAVEAWGRHRPTGTMTFADLVPADEGRALTKESSSCWIALTPGSTQAPRRRA